MAFCFLTIVSVSLTSRIERKKKEEKKQNAIKQTQRDDIIFCRHSEVQSNIRKCVHFVNSIKIIIIKHKKMGRVNSPENRTGE